MRRIWVVWPVAVVATWAVLAVPIPARATSVAGPSTITASFGTRTPGTPAGLVVKIAYRGTDGPQGKTPAITHLDIGLPSGTAFDGSAVLVCTASDAELMALGRLACPPDTQIGDGTISVDTGAGPPVDPATTDTVWYNGGDHLIEVVLARGTPAALARERLFVRQGHLVADVALFPGGPPNGTSVTDVTFTIYQRGAYLTTPRRCPPIRHWTFSALFGFDDGTTQAARDTMGCTVRR
jgi:hypothetical protein